MEMLNVRVPVTAGAVKTVAPDRKRFQGAVSPGIPAVVLDADGNVQHVTPAARRLLEYRPEQPIDSCFFSHVHGKHQYLVMRDVADMVCYNKTGASWLLRLRTGQSRYRWFRATVKSQTETDETIIVISLRDLSDY